MSEPLDSLIKDIEKCVRAKDPTSVERAAQLAEQYPTEPEVWHTLAFVHAKNRDMDGAVAATTRMMDVAPPHPSTFHSRGTYELKRGNLHAALADFDQGIALSKQLQDEWCLESLYFRRANVLVALGRKAEALADLEHVDDDLVEWATRLHTKFELVSECEGEPAPEVSMSEPLDSVVADINKRAQAEPTRTLERATQLTEKYPNEPKVWSLMVYAHAINSDMDGAVLAATRLINVAPHPANYYRRGGFEHERGNLLGALADFDKGIALAEQLQDEFYLETIHFARADVLVGLGRKAEARADLAHVSDGFAKYTTRLRTKEEILADCKE